MPVITGREPVLLDALSLLRRKSSLIVDTGSRDGSFGGDIGVDGFRGIGGETSVSTSSMTEAMEPGSPDRLSSEPSTFIGRGGTTGGDCLNRFGFDPVSAAGESCSLEREYLRKCPLLPVEMRLGAKAEGFSLPLVVL